jgi:uncharacterized protein YutE (UPF0331/DUF86 family)
MNWLQFFSSVVGSLAWPATVITLIVLLRAPVTRVLLTLTRLKYKDLELDFGRELKQLEEQAKAIEVKPQQPQALPAAAKGSAQLLAEAERLAQEFPEPAVAVGWQAIEDELMSAVTRMAVPPGYPPYNSALKNAELLLGQKAVDENTIDLLKRMRNLRNMAVHGSRGLGNVTTHQAIEFIALARGVVEKLSRLSRA